VGQIDNAKISARANSTKRKAKAGTGMFRKAEFINLELTEDQRKQLKSQPLDLEDADDALLKLNEAGYGLKLKWDEYSEAFAAFLQTDDEESENYGFILTGRGSTPLKALKQLLYKHFVMTEGEWWRFAKKPTRDEIDD